MNRTKMIHQLDRSFPDEQTLYVNAFSLSTEEQLRRIAEDFFWYCQRIWDRKYAKVPHETKGFSEYQIDYNRYRMIAQVRFVPTVRG